MNKYVWLMINQVIYSTNKSRGSSDEFNYVKYRVRPPETQTTINTITPVLLVSNY